MLKASLRLLDGTVAPITHIWTQHELANPDGYTTLAVATADHVFRYPLSIAEAHRLQNVLLAGGEFDERLNKVAEPPSD